MQYFPNALKQNLSVVLFIFILNIVVPLGLDEAFSVYLENGSLGT